MSITYFVTKTFVNNEVNTEATNRAAADKTIKDSITSVAVTANSLAGRITTAEEGIATLQADVDSRIGTDAINVIKFPDNYPGTRTDNSLYAMSSVANVKEGLLAVSSKLQNHINSFDPATLAMVTSLNSQVDGYIADLNAQKARIDTILALAPTETIDGTDQVVDTFDEVVKIINNLRTQIGTNDVFTTYKNEMDGKLLLKANIVQDINTKTRYIDATTGTPYKMYITNGQLAIEDVVL